MRIRDENSRREAGGNCIHICVGNLCYDMSKRATAMAVANRPEGVVSPLASGRSFNYDHT